jgi:hypothetical protein
LSRGSSIWGQELTRLSGKSKLAEATAMPHPGAPSAFLTDGRIEID